MKLRRGRLHAGRRVSALDADVIKTYVELGMGIGIITSMAFNPAKDSDLRLLKGEHLFGANTTYIALRPAIT